MLATVIWIGGLAILSILVIPAARKVLEGAAFAALLENLQRRLDPLAWFSIAALLGSGMLQMSANPNYQGFLSIDSLWAGAILIKHILFGVMILFNGYITWGIFPTLRRMALKAALGEAMQEYEALQKRIMLIFRINLIVGVFVLLLTAVARAA